MHRVRLIVLWLVTLAVPFQAFAAAAMVFCGPAQAVAAAAAPSAHGSHQGHEGHDGHVHARQAHDDGGHGGHGHAHADASPADHDASDTAQASSDGMHKCGTCGACQATALACSVAPVAFQHLPRADLSEPPSAVATVAPRLLDKPPRA